MCSECVQSVFRVCLECAQGAFRVCSECVQSAFSVCSECVQSVFNIDVISSPSASSVSIFGIFMFQSRLRANARREALQLSNKRRSEGLLRGLQSLYKRTSKLPKYKNS